MGVDLDPLFSAGPTTTGAPQDYTYGAYTGGLAGLVLGRRRRSM
jgi:hypothetical protein